MFHPVGRMQTIENTCPGWSTQPIYEQSTPMRYTHLATTADEDSLRIRVSQHCRVHQRFVVDKLVLQQTGYVLVGRCVKLVGEANGRSHFFGRVQHTVQHQRVAESLSLDDFNILERCRCSVQDVPKFHAVHCTVTKILVIPFAHQCCHLCAHHCGVEECSSSFSSFDDARTARERACAPAARGRGCDPCDTMR
eukprot:SAG31_NODE_1115_length_9839_cov_39.294661_6_plen_194_part_00